MDQDEKDNEHAKYFAGLINSLATAIIAGGCIAPGINYVYNILPPTLEGWQVNLMALSCVAGGLCVHMLGHVVIGSLK